MSSSGGTGVSSTSSFPQQQQQQHRRTLNNTTTSRSIRSCSNGKMLYSPQQQQQRKQRSIRPVPKRSTISLLSSSSSPTTLTVLTRENSKTKNTSNTNTVTNNNTATNTYNNNETTTTTTVRQQNNIADSTSPTHQQQQQQQYATTRRSDEDVSNHIATTGGIIDDNDNDSSNTTNNSCCSSGYMNGDFTAGIVCNVQCMDKSYCHSYYPTRRLQQQHHHHQQQQQLFVIGTMTSLDFYYDVTSSSTSNYQHHQYTLVYSVPHSSMISSIVWIESSTHQHRSTSSVISSQSSSSSSLSMHHDYQDGEQQQQPLLAVSDLDGNIYLYNVNLDILEIQGPTLLYSTCNNTKTQVQSQQQIRSMAYQYYWHNVTNQLLLVLVAGDKAGILTFITFQITNTVSSSSFDQEQPPTQQQYPQYLYTKQFYIRAQRHNVQQAQSTSKTKQMDHNPNTDRTTGILGIAFHEKRKLLALCTSDGLVQVYSLDHLMMIILLNENDTGSNNVLINNNRNAAGLMIWSKQNIGNTPIRTIVFDPINDTLIYGGYDKTISILDITNHQWTISRELHVHGTINTIQFDTNYRYLGVGGRDKTFTIFDTSTYVAIKVFHTTSWVTCISWASNNIVSIRSEPKHISIINFTPIQSTKIYRISQSEQNSMEVNSSLSWSKKGQYLAYCSGSKIIVADTHEVGRTRREFQDIASFDTRSGSVVIKILFCQVSNNAQLLAYIDDAGWLTILRLERKLLKLKLVSETLVEVNMKALAWSPNGDTLICGGKKKLLHAYAAAGLQRLGAPIALQGRIWDIDFVPAAVDSKAMYLGVALGDYTTVIFDYNLEPVLQISRTLTCRCLKFHPFSPIVAIGDGAGSVAIVDCDDGEVVTELEVQNRVNAIDFSPTGDFLVVGTDACHLTMYEGTNYQLVQELPFDSRPLSVAFSTNGFYLAVATIDNSYKMIQLGPVLGPEFIPLNLEGGVNSLPESTVQQVLFHSIEGPSLLQRHMVRGGSDNLRRVAAILQDHPTSLYTLDRSTGEGCFETAMRLKKPGLLKLFVTSLVDGTLNSTEEAQKTVLAASISQRGCDALYEIVRNFPSDFIIDVIGSITFMKVPSAYPRHVEHGDRTECGSSTYHDPWPSDIQYGLAHLEKYGTSPGSNTFSSSGSNRTPAVLPLPGLGSMKFLSNLLVSAPAEVFDNDAMALVLRVLWENYIRKYYYFDFCIFIVYYFCWIALVEMAAQSDTSTMIHISIKEISALSVLVPVVTLLNTMFAVKEVLEGVYGTKSLYWRSMWNVCDWFGIASVYGYTAHLLLTGNHMVPVAVATTLALTMKVLSYLRGFSSTGWLLSVLSANFQDVQGFLVIVTTILVGFSVAFRLLFAETGDEMYGSLRRSLLSTFELTLMGSYDTSILFETKYTVITIMTFIMAITCIVVVVLNALISILSDSYAKVQEHAVANRRREIASLIVEYMSLLPRWLCQRIEKETMWFHTLLEVDADGSLQVNSEDWEGGLNALRHDIEDMGRLYQQNYERSIERLKTDLDTDITKFKKEVVTLLEDLTDDIKYLRKIQSQNILNFDGHHIKKAVRAVKSVGRKGGAALFHITD